METSAVDTFISESEALMSLMIEAFIMTEALDRIIAIISKTDITTCFFFMILIKDQTL